jgi:hypothetical protein
MLNVTRQALCAECHYAECRGAILIICHSKTETNNFVFYEMDKIKTRDKKLFVANCTVLFKVLMKTGTNFGHLA